VAESRAATAGGDVDGGEIETFIWASLDKAVGDDFELGGHSALTVAQSW
jgi:hypothetical protein